jgi:hypothetical protein
MILNRRGLRLGAALGAAALTTLAAAPAFAAPVVSRASANAVNLSLFGNDVSTGTRTATNDGSGETVTGSGQLPGLVGVLDNNPILHIGVAGQSATAGVSGGDGVSAACAGVAGDGGTLVEVDQTDCIVPGKALTLSLANLDLSNTDLVSFDPSKALTSALADALGDPVLKPAVEQLLGPVTQQLSAALADTPLGEIGITGSLGAIQAQCTAVPGSAQGDSHLVDSNGGDGDSAISLTLPGQDPLVLVNLDAHPAPNTHVVTGLDAVTQEIIDALKVQLNTMVGGALQPLAGPLGDGLQQVQDQVVDNLVDQLRDPLLTPLQDAVLDITLNKQSQPADGAIDVTAFDLQLLPGAAEQIGFTPVALQLGHVTCGPNTTVAAQIPADAPRAQPAPEKSDQVIPTAVDSGVQGDSTNAFVILGATGALVLVAGAAGLAGYRRLLQK